MSTKIYNGFRVEHNNPALLMNQLKVLQKDYLENALSVLSASLPSGNLLGNSELDAKIEKEIEKIYNDRLMADVVIYFKKDKIIGQYFIHDELLAKKFRKQRWFKDYHYQNQSDPDDSVSSKEWRQRKKDWDFLNVPANDGFTFHLVNPNEIKPYWVACWRIEKAKRVLLEEK